MRDPKPSVFAIVQNTEGKILLVKKNYGKLDWTCPGGFMEAGETPEESIKREVIEESSCSIINITFRHVYGIAHRSDVILTFIAEVDEISHWTKNGEISDCSFFDSKNLPQPMTKETIRKIEDAFSEKNSQLFTLTEEEL
jgi:8-oxo-dGTP diphosphatase